MSNFFAESKKILGMNARNLEYSVHNTSQDKKFADNKIYTKNFLESRGIGVAKLYHVIDKYTQLSDEFFEGLPDKFVIKPNLGFAGAGIYVITEKVKKSWRTASGKKITKDDLYRHCTDILEGKYSISGTRDKVIFEELLLPHSDLRKLTEEGLTDVRVIVFNMVPVMAMMRVPTNQSDGKANMELGAYGLGIDMGTGKTTGAAYYSKYLKKLLNGQSAEGFKVPYWEEILLNSAKIQAATKIKYLGIDFVITTTGVKVLELNARPGLKIQIANKAPMKERLNKIKDLKIISPEEGVKIAKTLFSMSSSKIEKLMPEKPIIGIFESVTLNGENPTKLVAKIDLLAEENKISAKYFDEKTQLLDITLAEKRLKLPVKQGTTKEADILLAGKYLSDFLIDVNKKLEHNVALMQANLDDLKIKSVDKKVCEIDEQIKLLSYINPRNIDEQRQLFFDYNGVLPTFSYRQNELDIANLQRELKKIPVIDHILYPLFSAKIRELSNKLELINSVGTENFAGFSEQIFGKVTDSLYRKALDFLGRNSSIVSDDSEEMNHEVAAERMKEYLKNHNLAHWQIRILDESVADVQISKKGLVMIRRGAKFRENRLQALLVHEIGTHVFRNENGKLQPFQIFERGTADYLATEEGLAVYNQNALGLNLGEKFLTPALQIVAIYQAKNKNFAELFHYLKDKYDISDDLAWKLCLKSKRGTVNSANSGAFTKDSVYFRGNLEVEKFLDKGGNIKELYIGKINIKDLKILKNFSGIEKAKFLV
jgi:alpha-L-glutamate ligase-like protein/uncharacterized protein (TIGR02421 family)